MKKFIAWYQIIGGAIGILLIGMMVLLFLGQPSQPNQGMVLLFIPIALFGFSVIAGVYLLKNNKNAVKMTCVNQIIQIPQFILWGLEYGVTIGASAILSIRNTVNNTININLNGDIISSGFAFSFESEGWMIGINIVPIIILILLFRKKMNIENHDLHQHDGANSTPIDDNQ